MRSEHPWLSVVIPFHNEQDNLVPLMEELLPVLEGTGRTHEIILVDDGSTDNSLAIAIRLVREHPVVKCLELSRNFGQEQAILAGLGQASGEAVITMDSDLQHPPGCIPLLIEKFEEGYDVVNTSRKDAEMSWLKRSAVRSFYGIINISSGMSLPVSSFNFKLVSRLFLNEFVKLNEKARFDRGMIEWLGFKQCYVEYHANKRHRGRSNYPLRILLTRALGSITSFSVRPLRLFLHVGVFGFLLSLIASGYVLFQHFNGPSVVASSHVLAGILLLVGVQLLGIGIACEYLSVVYKEVKNRPNHVIRRTIE
jgi:glycosyltransferase involved in cell wall biosynthesis